MNDEKILQTRGFSMIFCEGWKPSVVYDGLLYISALCDYPTLGMGALAA